MMPVVLALANVLVAVLIVVSAVIGWNGVSPERVVLHMYWGVGTSILGLLAHTFTLFFFIGTGKAIRLACQDHAVARPFLVQSNRFKKTIAGRTMLGNLVLIVQPIIGAATYSQRLGSHWHYLGFWITLGVQLWVAYIELKLLGLNNVLMARVGEWQATGRLPDQGDAD